MMLTVVHFYVLG